MTAIEAALQFGDSDMLGRVAAVDTGRVTITVSSPDLLTRIMVGNLVAIRGRTQHEFLMAIVDRVTRGLRDELPSELPLGDEEVVPEPAPSDFARGALIGTYRTVDGQLRNTFKRGADSFPQIDRECYAVQGANLQRFM